MALYELTMQVVPLLMIAAFLDRPLNSSRPGNRAIGWYNRFENRATAVLGFTGFSVAVLIVADIKEPDGFTKPLVISALIGSIAILLAQIWRRLDRETAAQRSADDDAQATDD